MAETEPAPRRTTAAKKGAAAAGGAVVTAAMVAAIAAWTAPRTAPFEGFLPCPYVDKIGRGQPWTEGYGHTGPDVKPGVCIDHDQALTLLAKDEEKSARMVASCSPQYVVDNKYLWGAATDFGLNTGYYCRDPKGRPTSMARLFAANQPRAACDFYNRYVNSAGKVRGGLVRRRRFFVSDCMAGVRQIEAPPVVAPVKPAPAPVVAPKPVTPPAPVHPATPPKPAPPAPKRGFWAWLKGLL